MAVDLEVLAALEQSIGDCNQTDGLKNALAAWLKAMAEKELGLEDHKRHLDACKHSITAELGNTDL